MHFDFLTIAGAAMLLAAFTLQFVATRRVRRDTSCVPEQRRAQLWLIWLVPVLGAALVLTLLPDEPNKRIDRQERRNT